MRSLVLAVAVPVCAAFTGCATPYGSSGLVGGHFEAPLPGPLVKVSFAGNGYIGANKVQSYALYRCAELAKAAGKPHFVIYENLRFAAAQEPSRLPVVGTMGGKPLASAFLRLLDEPIPGSKATQQVLAELEPLIQLPVRSGQGSPSATAVSK